LQSEEIVSRWMLDITPPRYNSAAQNHSVSVNRPEHVIAPRTSSDFFAERRNSIEMDA
jgi:hypothetical protein